MDVKLDCSKVVIVMLAMVLPSTATTGGITAEQFHNGSHLYDYLYGGRRPAELQHEGDPWAQLIDLFNTVVYNTGPEGHTERRSERVRRQTFSRPGRSCGRTGRDDSEDQTEGAATSAEDDSVEFVGELAFAFPLLKIDIPFSGIEIPMFDYDSRTYYN